MKKKNKSSSAKSPKETGVLYVEYDKNSSHGQLIESLKDKFHYKLSNHVIELLFLSEIVESINCPDVDKDILVEGYYKSSQLFFDKFERANQKIRTITADQIRKNATKKTSYLSVESLIED